MLERRRLLYGGSDTIVKDNTMVWTFDPIDSEQTIELFTGQLVDSNDNELPFTTYVNGTPIGETKTVTLPVNTENIVEVQWDGDIYGFVEQVFLAYIGVAIPHTLDISRCDFSNVEESFIAINQNYMKQMSFHDVDIPTFIGRGFGTYRSSYCDFSFKNTTIRCIDSGGLGIELSPCGTITFENVTFISGGTSAPPIALSGVQQDILNLSTCKFVGQICGLNLFSNNLTKVYLNLDPNQVVDKSISWVYDGGSDGSHILYYNNKYDYSSMTACFPGWTLVGLDMAGSGIKEDDLEFIPKYLSINSIPESISYSQTTATISYSVLFENNIGQTRTDNKTYIWTTTENTSSVDVTKEVIISDYGLTASTTIVHKKKQESGITGLDRMDVIAGDFYVIDSNNNGYFVRDTVPSGTTPIGVVVIPPSHNVYGNNVGAIISLKAMPHVSDNSNTEHSGISTPVGLWAGAFKSEMLSSPTIYAYGRVNNQSNTHTLSYTDDTIISNETLSFASDLYSGGTYSVACIDDSNSWYYSSSSVNTNCVIPSPYLSDGSRNPKYGKEANDILKFDGRYKTSNKLSYGKITSSDYTGEEAARSCNLYNVGSKTWFLPDLGEVGYLAARVRTIRKSLDKLYSLGYRDVTDLLSGYGIIKASTNAGIGSTGIISSNYSLWNSDYHFRYFDWSNGEVRQAVYNTHKGPVHAFAIV